jgi:hypothetical protein
MTTTRKSKLDKDHREVLEALAAAPNGLNGLSIQGACESWPIRPAIDSLTRRKLIDHDGYHFVPHRQYKITDAGREALS